MDTLNYSFVRRPFEPVNIRRRDFLLLPRECRQVSGELKVLATRGGCQVFVPARIVD